MLTLQSYDDDDDDDKEGEEEYQDDDVNLDSRRFCYQK